MTDKIGIYDNTTGEQIIREMTIEEQAERDSQVASWLAEKTAKEQQEAESRANKISAYQKLGLSEAEIEALLPTPQPLNRD